MAGNDEDNTKIRRNSTVHNTNCNSNSNDNREKEEEQVDGEMTRLDKLDPPSSASSTSGGESSSLSSGDLPPPPDGGWGWVVVFASFMIHVVGKCPNIQYVWSGSYVGRKKDSIGWVFKDLINRQS